MSNDLAARVQEARIASLGTLVAGLAHELNTPLGALTSNHDVLRRAIGKLQEILADEVVDAHELEEVRRVIRAFDGILRVNDMAVERMSALVVSFRKFGRLDQADLDVVDLHEGIDSTLAILAHELRTLHVRRDYGELPRIECHPQQLNQVFMNLLMNARQATPDGGTVTVRTRVAGDSVEVSVQDTGAGIPAENLDRIFEPGFTSKGGRVGMGLGLAICQQIMEQHRGSIAVASKPGAGATFTLVLPRRHAPPEQHRNAATTLPTGGS